MLDADYYVRKSHEDTRNLQNNLLANKRNEALIASNLLIKQSLDQIKLENAKLVAENKQLTEELKRQNEKLEKQNAEIKSLKAPRWQFWVSLVISFIAAIGAVVGCII